MIDFSKAKVSKGVNKKQGKPKEKVSLSKRITTEQPSAKPKLEIKNFNISMYKKLYCFCDTCNTETVHYLKDERTNCIYCKGGYSYLTHGRTSIVPKTPIPLINGLIFM